MYFIAAVRKLEKVHLKYQKQVPIRSIAMKIYRQNTGRNISMRQDLFKWYEVKRQRLHTTVHTQRAN